MDTVWEVSMHRNASALLEDAAVVACNLDTLKMHDVMFLQGTSDACQ